MRGRRGPWSKVGASMIALTALVVGAVAAQDNPPAGKGAAPGPGAAPANPKGKTSRKGALLKAPGREPAKGVRKAGNPLAAPAEPGAAAANAPGRPLPAPGTFRYRFKFAVGSNEPLAASYYPSKLGDTSSVVLLVHERERSSKDFEDSIDDLKKYTLAETLQNQGYAIRAIDVRGH